MTVELKPGWKLICSSFDRICTIWLPPLKIVLPCELSHEGWTQVFHLNCRFIQKIWKFTVSSIIHKASGLSCEHLSSFSCLIPVTFTVFNILMKPYDKASVLSTCLAFLLRDYIGFSYFIVFGWSNSNPAVCLSQK